MFERFMIFVKVMVGDVIWLVSLEKFFLGKLRLSWGMKGGNIEVKFVGFME